MSGCKCRLDRFAYGLPNSVEDCLPEKGRGVARFVHGFLTVWFRFNSFISPSNQRRRTASRPISSFVIFKPLKSPETARLRAVIYGLLRILTTSLSGRSLSSAPTLRIREACCLHRSEQNRRGSIRSPVCGNWLSHSGLSHTSKHNPLFPFSTACTLDRIDDLSFMAT